MTRPRAAISASLSARGRAENWANEDEAAALSGMCGDIYRAQLAALETAGFPKRSPWNGKRFIPAILAFFEREHENAPPVAATLDVDDERAKERFGHGNVGCDRRLGRRSGVQ